MKINIENESFDYPNQVDALEKLFEIINQKLEEKNLQLSHLIIDEVMIKENYYNYFVQNIEKIRQVDVICNNLEILVDETLLSAYNYLKNGKPLIEKLANTFYQSSDEASWDSISDLIDGIEWLINTQARIDQLKNLNSIMKDYAAWNEFVKYVNKLIAIIPDLEMAMKQNDHVLIGDLLLYEILPFFENGEEKLRFLIPNEGSNYVS